MIDGCRERLSATTDARAAVAGTELTHVIVPTPSGPDARFSLKHVFGLCYNPEFIALENVIEGLSDPRSGQLLEDFYATICGGATPAARMPFVNAELTKLSVNTFVTTKISHANMLAQVCEKLPGADVDVVTSALGLDTEVPAWGPGLRWPLLPPRQHRFS